MTNWKFKKEEINDVDVINYYKILVEDRKVYTEKEFMDLAHLLSRDNARTPL